MIPDHMHVDYDRIGPTYDAHRRGGGPYFSTLVSLARETACGRVLEIGAGTGNNTALLARELGRTVVALERSQGMLRQGAAKAMDARWVHGEGVCLPFRDGAFDFVFACYVLHHIPDLVALFRACRRVMDRGVAAFITVPEDFIARHPMNAYFPSFAPIDLARFQPIHAVQSALDTAGFAEVQVKNTVAAPVPIDAAYVKRIEGRFISTYDLVPEDEFTEGLARLKADVARRGALDHPMVREATVVWGYRRCEA